MDCHGAQYQAGMVIPANSTSQTVSTIRSSVTSGTNMPSR